MLISLSLGILLLWLITRGQDVGLIVQHLRQANFLWIFLAMICALVSHFLRAVRWNMLIGTMGYHTRPFQTFYAVMTGYLANLAIPRMGEITRCVTLGKASNTPFNALAGTVVAERVFDVISLFFIVVMTIAFQFVFLKDFIHRLFWEPLLARGTGNWGSIVLALAILLLLLTLAAWQLWNKLRAADEDSIYFRIKRQLRGFVIGFKTIARLRGKVWFLVYTVCIWGLYYLTVYLCFFAIEATSHLSPIVGVTLLAVGSLGILAPVPGGIGTYHFLTIITLVELYGIESEPATSYAYITHATQIAVNVLAGSASWIILSVHGKRPWFPNQPDQAKHQKL